MQIKAASKRALHCVTPVNLFVAGTITLIALTLYRAAMTDGMALYTLFYGDSTDTFMDFFNSIYDAGFENPYLERGVIYPALTYLYYRLCGAFLPEGYTALQWRDSQYGLVLIVISTAAVMLALYHVLKNEDKKNGLVLKLVLFGTVPFWYAIERGNLILVTLVFLAYFVMNYRSEDEVKREFALISLAISTATKIYPACFGLLLLLDKRYKEALRCAIYGVIAMAAPFFFFGGSETIGVMLQNIMNTSAAMATWGYGYKLNLDNTFGFTQMVFNIDLPGTQIAKWILLAFMGYVLVATRKDWQRCMVLCSVMILLPGFSYTYTMIFAAIPLMMFLGEAPKTTTMNLLFSSLFVFMFAPMPVIGAEALNLTTVLSSYAIIAMNILLVVDVVLQRRRKAVAVKEAGILRAVGSYGVIAVATFVLMIIVYCCIRAN